MPLFHFHLRTPHGLDRDDTGLDMANVEAAYLEACRAIPDMALELMQKGESPGRYSFKVTNAVGQVVWLIPFTEVLGRIPGLRCTNLRRLG